MPKLGIITVETPFGSGEAFVLSELCALRELGADMLAVPRDRAAGLFHKKAESLLGDTLCIPWLDIGIAKEFIRFICVRPGLFMKIINAVAFRAGNVKTALKNLVVLPKAVFLARIFRQRHISHIHAHWGTTTSTMAYIINQINGIPWSFTVHRGDISDNNILKAKCETAAFIRCIDANGLEELAGIVRDAALKHKMSVIHMGVAVPELADQPAAASGVFNFLCPANFVPKKGHKYLLEGCRILADKGVEFKCLIAGDGHLEQELKRMAASLGLNGYVEFTGRLPHEELFRLYGERKIQAVVLPSIVTEDRQKEGIPVALMEAMAYGIPVISTNTGGIPELIGNGEGIMIPPGDSAAIAGALERLACDRQYYRELCERGRRKIEADFNLNAISANLLRLVAA